MGAFLTALALKIFFFDFILTEGRSMLPSIASGRLLFVNKVSYGIRLPLSDRYLLRWAEPKNGDVVVFWTPNGDLAVKRFESYPETGKFRAIGDNAGYSYDSRSYGPVPTSNILGKAVGIQPLAATVPDVCARDGAFGIQPLAATAGNRARDRSGNPTAAVTRRRGVGADSPVPAEGGNAPKNVPEIGLP